jgi:hypothetical protein
MFDEHLCLFGGEFPTAGLTAKTDFTVKIYLSAATSWAAYILIFWLKHFLLDLPLYSETLIISHKCFIGEIQADVEL